MVALLYIEMKDIYVGRDGIARSVSLKMSSGETNRPISKLYPLEVSTTVERESLSGDCPDQRPQRLAAVRARSLIKNMT